MEKQNKKKLNPIIKIIIGIASAIFVIVITLIIIMWALAIKSGTIRNNTPFEFLDPEPGTPTNYNYIDLKPVIYLYPTQQQKTKVLLDYAGKLTYTYPTYNDGWSITAYPDGQLIDNSTGETYSYLFWEGEDENAKYDLSTGFIIKGEDTTKFLQEKLANIGLTPKEYNEFIVYWAPRMQGNDYNLIHFATYEEYDQRARINIDPKPQSVLRVFMVYKALDRKTAESIEIVPQSFETFERNGFTVVEWGGSVL